MLFIITIKHTLKMCLLMILGSIHNIFNTLKNKNFQVLERQKTLFKITVKRTLKICTW